VTILACSSTQDFSSTGGPGGPKADAPPGEDLPPCGDLGNDPSNCGVCGHSCLGGACVAGACQPVRLASAGSVGGIALDDGFVYYAETNTISRVPIAGGEPKVLVTLPGQLALATLAIDAGHLYFAYDDGATPTIARAPIDGGAPEDLGASCYVISAFAVRGGTLTFTCDDAISTCPATGCGGKARTLDAHLAGSYERASLTTTTALALAIGHADAAAPSLHVYALDGTTSCATPFGDPRQRVSPETAAVAFDGANAFVASLTRLWRVDPACSAPVLLTEGARVESAVRVVANDASVIWGQTYLYDGSLLRCPKTGCAEPEVLASAQGFVFDVAATNDAVYWVSSARVDSSPTPGTVMKLALAPSNVPPWKGH
jgi:hypothetical protein